ncbi:MAG: polysaccharide biosynthesis/export family protein [Myxococcota bacterium]
MKWLVWLFVTVAWTMGCKPTPQAVVLPAPIESNTVEPGDRFSVEIIGEDRLPKEYEVAPDGTVALPFINKTKVAGLEQQQIRDVVRRALIEGGFFTDPVVVVTIKSLDSKRITVAGEVKKPDDITYASGMTLTSAIAKVGGMTTLARSWAVVLVRRLPDGETKRVVVDYDAINQNEIPDVPLQPGDKVTVPQRAF